MVILREKVRCIASSNLLIRAAAYDTVRTQTVLPLHQIKVFGKEMKRHSTLRINNTLVENYECRLNPDAYYGIYTNSTIEAKLGGTNQD